MIRRKNIFFFVRTNTYGTVFLNQLRSVPWCQFHQRFMYEFFIRMSFLAAFFKFVSALAPKFCMKNARVNVDEIDTWNFMMLEYNKSM